VKNIKKLLSKCSVTLQQYYNKVTTKYDFYATKLININIVPTKKKKQLNSRLIRFI